MGRQSGRKWVTRALRADISGKIPPVKRVGKLRRALAAVRAARGTS